MNKHRLILVLIAMVIFAATYTLLQNHAIAGEKAQMKQRTITGKVVQTEKGAFVLKTTWKSYGLSGMDLSRLLGNKVKVTGNVTNGKTGSIINVVKVEKVK